jgi:hypothetical protein
VWSRSSGWKPCRLHERTSAPNDSFDIDELARTHCRLLQRFAGFRAAGILRERDEQPECQARPDEQDQQAHGGDPLPLGRAQRTHDIEGHRLVLDLFDQVPGEERRDLVVELVHRRPLVAEGVFGDDRRPVLDRSGDRELGSAGKRRPMPRLRSSTPVRCTNLVGYPMACSTSLSRSCSRWCIVSCPMKAFTCLRSSGSVDLGAVLLDRVDHEPLALGDDRRHQRDEVTREQVAAGEVPLGESVAELEPWASGRDRPGRRWRPRDEAPRR